MISPEFVPKVLADQKRQTMRPSAWTPGERYSLRVWVGKPYRSKQREVCVIECTDAAPAGIFLDGLELRVKAKTVQYHDDENHIDLEAFAQADGFASWGELLTWFDARYVLPWYGYVNYFKRIET